MVFEFYKYAVAGNDFIVVDNRQGQISLEKEFWAPLCARRTGIGADGVLLVENLPNYDFSMRYLNADGGEVSMCGNGARAITHFCHHVLGLKKDAHYRFMTKAGPHEAFIRDDYVKLKIPGIKDKNLIQISDLFPNKNCLFVNTGVPHAIFEVGHVASVNVNEVGSKVRYDQRFPEGTNANFYQVLSHNKISLRTYERGVESETLACGTGAIASALCFRTFYPSVEHVEVVMPGGLLEIEFALDFSYAFLSGHVQRVFKGTV